MSPGTAPLAVAAVPAPPTLTLTGVAELVGARSAARAVFGQRLVSLLSALGDAGGMLAIAYCVPLVILAIGIPVALLVRLLGWLTGTF
jgi:hypothetical protein